MELKEVKEQLVEWLRGFRYANYKEEDCIYIDEDNVRVKMILYTNDNSYSISARPPGSKGIYDKGYLGCICNSRKPRAGEEWTRGNDLVDGPFCYEIWTKILGDIVGYELVKIQRPISLIYQKEEKEKEKCNEVMTPKEQKT